MVKKIVCFMLMFSVLFTTLNVYAERYPDTIGLDCERAADVLMDLSLMFAQDSGEFEPDVPVTRAEAIVGIMRLLNLSDITTPSKQNADSSYFGDVPLDYWAVEDINLGVDMKIISAADKFYPDDYVTYEQLLKMTIVALGYSLKAEQNGGYPSGYLGVAYEKKLLSDIKMKDIKEPVTKGNMAIILYNALDVEFMEPVSYSNIEVGYDTDQTLLEAKFDIVKGRGVVTANDITALSGDSPVSEGYVEIDGLLYNIGETSANLLLGMNVEYYSHYDKQIGENVLKSIFVDNNRQDVTVLESNDTLQYYAGEYKYISKVNDKYRSYKVSKTADIIYNGKAYLSYPSDKMCPQNGEVRLVDNNRDGNIDTVFIKSYSNYIFEAYNSLDRIIYSFNAQKITLDEDGKYYVKKSNGEEVEFENIFKYDVISAAISKDGMYGEFIIASNSEDGAVEAYSSDDSTVEINGAQHKICNDIYIKSGELKAGAKGLFYYDFKGNLAAFERDDSAMAYGYLTAMGKKSNIGGTVEMKIFSSSGVFVTYKSADKIKLDGTSVSSKDLISDISGGSGTVTPQIIRYRLNEDNEVCEIDTTSNVQSPDSLHVSVAGGNSIYRSGPRTLEAKIYVGGACTIFMIPADKNDEDLYFALSSSGLQDSRQYTYDAYSTTSDLKADVVTVLSEVNNANITENVDLSVVDSVRIAIDSYGDESVKLSLFTGGVSTSVYVDAGQYYDVAAALKKGDVIRYSLNSTGKVNGLQIIYSTTNQKFMPIGNVNRRFRSFCGVVYDMDDSLVRILPASITNLDDNGIGDIIMPSLTEPNTSLFEVYPASDFNIYIYDKSRDKDSSLYVGTLSDIESYVKTGESYLSVISTAYATPEVMLIIKD